MALISGFDALTLCRWDRITLGGVAWSALSAHRRPICMPRKARQHNLRLVQIGRSGTQTVGHAVGERSVCVQQILNRHNVLSTNITHNNNRETSQFLALCY
jgi:hypothetical protein